MLLKIVGMGIRKAIKIRRKVIMRFLSSTGNEAGEVVFKPFWNLNIEVPNNNNPCSFFGIFNNFSIFVQISNLKIKSFL